MTSIVPFTRDFVYTGIKTDSAGKRFMAFCPLDDGGKLQETPLLFAEKRGRGYRFSVGHVYRIPGEAEDGEAVRLSLGQAEWQREFPGEARVVAWQAAHLAAERTARAKQIEKREATNTSQLEELMEPLRRAYNRLPIIDRPAFETWVLMTLRRK